MPAPWTAAVSCTHGFVACCLSVAWRQCSPQTGLFSPYSAWVASRAPHLNPEPAQSARSARRRRAVITNLLTVDQYNSAGLTQPGCWACECEHPAIRRCSSLTLFVLFVLFVLSALIAELFDMLGLSRVVPCHHARRACCACSACNACRIVVDDWTIDSEIV